MVLASIIKSMRLVKASILKYIFKVKPITPETKWAYSEQDEGG